MTAGRCCAGRWHTAGGPHHLTDTRHGVYSRTCSTEQPSPHRKEPDMTTTLAPIFTPAELIAAALGLPSDDRIRVEITRNTVWDNSWCEETGRPAAVNVTWSTTDSDGDHTRTDRALAADVAADYIAALTVDHATDPYETIRVEVSHQWARFTHPDLAGSL